MDDRIAQLERLARLRDTGALSTAEFEAEKARLLGQAPSGPARGGAATPPGDPYSPFAGPARPTVAGDRGGATTWIVIGLIVALFIIGGATAYAMGMFRVPAPKGGTSIPDADNVYAIATPASIPSFSASPSPSPSPSPTPVDFTSSIGFANAAACQFAPEGDRLFQTLLVADGANRRKAPAKVTIGGFTTRPIFSVKPSTDPDDGPGAKIYEAAVKFDDGATWNGLKLSRALDRDGTFPDIEGWTQRRLTFLDPPGTVAAAFARLGLTLSTSGDKVMIRDGNGNGQMWIEKVAGGTAFVCDYRS